MPSAPPRPAARLHPSASITPPSAFFLIAVGCLGIAGQLVLLRELMAAYGGNEISAGVTLAAWMLCEALGAWLAGRSSLASAAPVEQRIVYRLSFLTPLSIIFSLIAVPAAVLVRPLLGVLPGEVLSIPLLLLATFLVVLLPAASHGALFVTAAAQRQQGIGSAYVWEGIGTVLAGGACFLLLNRLPSVSVVAFLALPVIVAAAFGHGRTWTKWTMWTLGFGVLAAVVFALPIERMAWGAAWRGQRVTAVTNSAYGKIVELERAGQQLVLYDGIPILTVPPTQSERSEELALLPVLIHSAPRRVLVLGHDPAIPAAMARFRPDIEVTTVQLDPILARIALTAMLSDSSLLTPPFSLLTADPVSFLRSVRDTSPSPKLGVRTSEFGVRRFYDCIVLTDATPSSLGASRLFSLEFYRLCRSRLAPGGILAAAGPGNPTGLSPDVTEILSTRLRTLEAAFEHVLPLAADFPLLLASDQPLNVSTADLLDRLARLSESPMLLDSSYVSSLFAAFRQEALSSSLQPGAPDTEGGFSSAALPRELFLNMVRENRLVSPGFGAFYARLASFSVHRSPFTVLLLSTVLLVVGLAGARVRGRPFSRGFAILTSGFSGAAVSSLLIFVWQVRFGSVYSGVALLVAAFMFGTVLGSGLGSRLSSIVLRSSYFVAADITLAACAAAATLLLQGGPAILFLIANCLAGACLGFQFALAGSAAANRHSPIAIRQSAGLLTALDLAGGSLGGILTALLLVPVLGIGAAALCAGAVKVASALVQLMSARPAFQP